MKIKYRHVSEPDRVKIVDMDFAYQNCGPLGPQWRSMSLEDYEKFRLEQFAKDKAEGRILEYEVVDGLSAEELRRQGIVRFNAIPFMALASGVHPYEMAVSLKKQGFEIVFDDSSISSDRNSRRKGMFERIFAEAELGGKTFEEKLADAVAAAKEVNQGRDSVMQELVKE